MNDKKKIKLAFKFGKKEHKYGRWIVVPIFVSCGYNIYKNDVINLFISMFILTYWVIYISSHTLEKYFFDGKGPRSGWRKKK